MARPTEESLQPTSDLGRPEKKDSRRSRATPVRSIGDSPERLLSVSEAAQCIGCCEETLRRAYLAGQLEVLRFGARRVRIRRSALFAWLERGGKTTAA